MAGSGDDGGFFGKAREMQRAAPVVENTERLFGSDSMSVRA